MEAAWLVWQARPPQSSLTVVVKATYALPAEGVAQLAEEQALPTGDEHFDDDPERSLRYASDLDVLKPHGECLVVGHVRSGGAARLRASMQIGAVQKHIAVFGERTWQRGNPSPPEPFDAIPLAWESAFGGPGQLDNPVGRGLAAAPGEEVVRLPNIEHPEQLALSRDARPAPMGLSPIPRTWASRMRFAGTYDAAWLSFRYPWFPEDIDWRFFCAAPLDQQVQGYWRGDEEIALEGLHPEHARVRTRLPGLAAHAYLVPEGGGALRDVGLRLDTIVVDADAGVAHTVWRGVVEVAHEDLSDIGQLFVTHAALGEAVDAPARHQAELARLAAEEEELEAKDPVAAPEEVAEADAPDAGEEADAPKPASGATMPVPPADPEAPGARWAHLDQAMTIRGDDRSVQDALQKAIAERTQGGIKSVFDDALGLDAPVSVDRELSPEEMLELEMSDALGDLLEAPEDSRRREVREAVARGESLAGWDLSGVDLSGVGLVGADLRGTILARANLSGAYFEKCVLDGAQLAEAELSMGSFDSCSFVGASLHGSRAQRVRFHDCKMQDATLTEVFLHEARFMTCDLSRAELAGSDASKSDWRECELGEADLSGSILAEAVFSRCRLVDTWLEGGVDAPRAVFDGCDASLLRASEGANLEGASFKKTKLDGARFGTSRLRGAVLNLATLTRADFSESFLHEASLIGCDLRAARFDGASLVNAALTRSNLMQASLAKANLSGADLRGANLFQAELMDAKLSGARTDLANLEGTRFGEPS